MSEMTLVVGASLNPIRYSNIAIKRLLAYDKAVMAFGLRKGEVDGIPIETDQHFFLDKDIHTVTLYVGPARQAPLFDWLIQLAPKRVIFNPGTENPVFEDMLHEAGIEVVPACTLVMLATHQY